MLNLYGTPENLDGTKNRTPKKERDNYLPSTSIFGFEMSIFQGI